MHNLFQLHCTRNIQHVDRRNWVKLLRISWALSATYRPQLNPNCGKATALLICSLRSFEDNHPLAVYADAYHLMIEAKAAAEKLREA